MGSELLKGEVWADAEKNIATKQAN